jgi:hypothetical protein
VAAADPAVLTAAVALNVSAPVCACALEAATMTTVKVSTLRVVACRIVMAPHSSESRVQEQPIAADVPGPLPARGPLESVRNGESAGPIRSAPGRPSGIAENVRNTGVA